MIDFLIGVLSDVKNGPKNVGPVVSAAPVAPIQSVDEESRLRDFFDSLTPDQMTKLVLSNLLAKAFGPDTVEEASPERSFPHENFRKGFDFDAWQKRRGPKVQ